jgi:hypothetical protein
VRRVASPMAKLRFAWSGTKCSRAKSIMARRRIDPHDRAGGQPLGDLSGDLAVAAADVEDALRSFQLEAGQALVGKPLLQRRPAMVLRGVPFGHAPVLTRARGSHKSSAARSPRR